MTEESVHGPVDFVLIEFPDDHLTGRAAAKVVDLVRRGIIRVYDVLVVGKDSDGETYALDLAELAAERLGGFQDLAWAITGLLGEDDIARRQRPGAGTPGGADRLREHLGGAVRGGGPRVAAASWWPAPGSPPRT